MLAAIYLGLGLIILFLIGVWITDMHRFVVVPYFLTSDKINKKIKMVVISDLHNKVFGENNKKLIDAILKQAPDLIIIAGDMFTSNGEPDFSTSIALLKEIRSEIGQKTKFYYANGNHEQKVKRVTQTYGNLFEQYKQKLQNEKIVFLENENKYLSEYNINICGLEIEKKYFRRMKKVTMETSYIRNLVGEPKPEQFQILLAHNPEYFETYADWGAELTLSGHIHGGVMKLPFLGGVISPSFQLFPKYDGGLFEKEGKKMVLSRGLGTHTLPVRIFNPGELVVIELRPKDEHKEEK